MIFHLFVLSFQTRNLTFRVFFFRNYFHVRFFVYFCGAFGRIGATLVRDCDTERPRVMDEEFCCSVME